MGNIVYLYSEIMPYQIIVFRELSKMGYCIHAFYLDKKIQTCYILPNINNVYYYKSSEYDKALLLSTIHKLNPVLMVVCGWSEEKYLYVSRYMKRNTSLPIVCPIDTQYNKTLRQYVGFLISPFYIKSAFTHIWVPGCRQYEFAKRLGYSNENIIFNSLTGDVDLFKSANLDSKELNYPRKILYVGRYNKVKGLDLLVSVWEQIEDRGDWELILAGNGPMREELETREGIKILDFQSQENLVKLSEECGLFILPSLYEPWALVLHEFAAAGLPILCSDACGASSHFVINGYNGFTFKRNNFIDLKNRLEYLMHLTDKELYNMAVKSRKLSLSVNPELSANSLLSVLK